MRFGCILLLPLSWRALSNNISSSREEETQGKNSAGYPLPRKTKDTKGNGIDGGKQQRQHGHWVSTAFAHKSQKLGLQLYNAALDEKRSVVLDWCFYPRLYACRWWVYDVVVVVVVVIWSRGISVSHGTVQGCIPGLTLG